MTAPPSFSVVVPAFNAEATVMACVESVLRQTVSDLELIAVDDGSTDATGALLDSMTDARARVVHQSNRGLSAARNTGISEARGNIVCLLDSDDLWLPHYLEVVAQTFHGNPQAAMVYTDAWALDDRTRRIRKQTAMHWQRPPSPPPADPEQLFCELLSRNFVLANAAAYLDALRVVGPFDERLTSAEDWDMWLRMAAHGFLIAATPEPLAVRRLHASQMSGDTPRMIRNIVAVLEKVLCDYVLSTSVRMQAERALAGARAELAIVDGTRRGRALLRRERHRAGRLSHRLGGGDRWYAQPPAPVAEAFGDLRNL